ncbi:hypothetical protein JL721_11497 [Aureococcus anophagefferens]|nr:hypothetical protein JL721_11497 [Aureococcus anophagefferens]
MTKKVQNKRWRAVSHVGTGGYTFVPQREVEARHKRRGGQARAHAHCAAFKHGWIVPVGRRHGAHLRGAVEDFEASVRQRAAQPRAALTRAVPAALDAYGGGDFGEPAPAYTRGFATLAVTPRGVSLRRTIPLLKVFDADWVPGQGPLHFGCTLARSKGWLVGRAILILEWEGKTSVWRPYTVVSWDATVFGLDVNATPSTLMEFGSHVISDSEDEQRVCLFNEVARLDDEHDEASDDEESDDEADYDIVKFLIDLQGPIEDHFKDANRESFMRRRRPGGGPLPPREAGAPPPPLACNNWGRGAECYGAVYARGAPPAPGPRGDGTLVRWFDEPALHSARILPGHFGHDVLNNYLYARAGARAPFAALWKPPKPPQVFNTMWEANLTHLLDAGSLTHVVDDTVASPFGDRLVRSVAYTPNPAQDKSDATSLQLLPGLRGGVGGRGRGPAAPRELLRLAAGRLPHPRGRADPRPGLVELLFANGRGRRVVNVDALVAALAPLGDVEAFDPGLLPLGDQIRKAASADVLVSRMSSQVVLAMFVPPGGLAVELEAPDPSKLYYDHASTFGELAELFGHAFNWWLGDAEADVPAVVALVSEHLGCA